MNKQRLKEPLFDLKKYFPNYFNVWVFRAALLVILLFTVFVSFSNGWGLSFNYAYCPVNDFDEVPCTITYKPHLFASTEEIIIEQGTSWGDKPNFWGLHFKKFVFGILALGFIVNHNLYRAKYGGKKS